MKLVDANVLLYSVNTYAEHHNQTRKWIDNALSGSATVAFAWIALLAFLRLSTKPGLFPNPLAVDQAVECVESWLSAGPAVVLEPTVDHARILHQLLRDVGSGGNLVSDAHLAALAIEHKCVVVSYDNDFDRFEGLRRETPGNG
ncbi:MAG TPA: TA system VapC family ribonuclease toxin [Acidimicrobiia bacterium]|nr:TA system VapC family ribonuclease toxin [Acidimicrobiia bacterium]